MHIQQLDGKKICIVGYDREGKAMLNALKKYAPQADVTIADSNTAIQGDATLQLGADYLKNLDNFDVIIRSSGIKNTPELAQVAAKTTDMTRIFFDSIAGTGVRTVGVTGSKGKSTTSTLIYEALKAHDPQHTFLMGNIGIPMIDFLPHANTGATFVIELSSYMLEHLRVSPNIAVVTSFFPEHLDRHGSIDAYWAAKKNIAAHQKPQDAIFYNADYAQCQELAQASPGRKFPFRASDFPLDVAETKFKGAHNRSNLAAALAVATFLGVPKAAALETLKNVSPLPHRLQNLGKFGGITWVNDSFSTAPEATIAALDALAPDVDTLLIGGVDRGVDYSGLAAYLADSPVHNIVIFPDTGQKIRELMPKNNQKIFFETSDMAHAVAWAAAHTAPGKTCLLSPASPSFNLFKDFVVRGEAFVAAVQKLG